jgi:EAL domain-containing protein (putative c-di-GMP-specific phosphodiesterase class I)/GGDEF domain-containing protein
VIARQQDAAVAINSTLRNAGHPVHCSWITEAGELAESLAAHPPPQLLFCCLTDEDEAAAVAELRNRYASAVPLLLVRDAVTEGDLVRGVQIGAQDVVTLHARDRLRAVAERELNSGRLDRALAGTLAAARQYHDQMRVFMSGSADAIAHVQEGIVVDVNPAWVELFGHRDPAELVGTPLMDGFDPQDRVAIKGALVAASQNRWPGKPLTANSRLPGGATQSMELLLESFAIDGEPAVRLRISTHRREYEQMARRLQEALRIDAATGLLKRAAFMELAGAQSLTPLKAGARYVLYLEPDANPAVEKELGALGVEELLEACASLLCTQLQPGDVAARVSPRGFALLVGRGNARDLEAWLERLLQRLAEHVFQVGERSLNLTVSAGVASSDPQGEPLTRALQAAVRAHRAAVAAGGNRSHRHDPDGRAALEGTDRIWAGQIRAALMANRFRLVQQPIASLVGEDAGMYDLVVRMLDDKGREVLPSEFLAAAERTDLLKNIDRWVIGAAVSFCGAKSPNKVFVRLSRDSLRDTSLGPWLRQQLAASRLDARRVVFQVPSDLAAQHVRETRELQGLLRGLGFGFAFEGFGADRDPLRLLQGFELDYVKVDGSLMQGLASDANLQQEVRELVQAVRARGITTIAERVEDANTLAVLWQLGIEYVQGYFVNSPEDVVLGA